MRASTADVKAEAVVRYGGLVNLRWATGSAVSRAKTTFMIFIKFKPPSPEVLPLMEPHIHVANIRIHREIQPVLRVTLLLP